jgi:hypothetical protein
LGLKRVGYIARDFVDGQSIGVHNTVHIEDELVLCLFKLESDTSVVKCLEELFRAEKSLAIREVIEVLFGFVFDALFLWKFLCH